MSKLLHKPLKAFTAYALVILALSIPVYYYIVDSIWIEELDEHNEIICEQTRAGFNQLDPEALDQSLALWNKVQPESRIVRVVSSVNAKDSVYTVGRQFVDDGETETERFRGLLKTIVVHGKPYRITIETNVEEADETVFAISVITCIFIALLITGFILLNRWLSKRIWKPFYDTLDKLQAFDLSHEKRIELAGTGIVEFTELNKALEKLIDKSIDTYRQQKEFTQNASHELQTPLALLKSKLDLLVQDNQLSKKQRQTIESLNLSVSRISRINKNLLLLAKIENQDYETQQIALSDLVNAHIELFQPVLKIKQAQLRETIAEHIHVKANEGLTEILVGNLLSNAVRYSQAGGKITVALTAHNLTVANAGTMPLNEKNMFKRFSSASSENPGSGLGLAIVKEICDKMRWKVKYEFNNSTHIFSVRF